MHDIDLRTTEKCHLCQVGDLTVATALPWPGFAPGRGSPDITVEAGTVPRSLDCPHRSWLRVQAAAGVALVTVDGVARFLVEGGQRIVYESLNGCDDDSLVHLLTHIALSICLVQRGGWVVDATTVVGQSGAITLIGEPGCGRSTIAARLVQRGLTLLADGPTRIGCGHPGERPKVGAHDLRLKLWEEAIHQLGEPLSSYTRLRAELPWRAHNSPPVVGEPACLRCVYLLQPASTDRVEFSEVVSAEKLELLVAQTAFLHLVRSMGSLALAFEAAADIAAAVPLRVVRFPKNWARFEATVEDLLADLVRTGE